MPGNVLVTDYYELIALFRTIRVAKFSLRPMNTELVGNPNLASAATRIAQALDELELDRGHPERANWHSPMTPDSPIWKQCVNYALLSHEDWKSWSFEDKRRYASVIMSPSSSPDEILELFVSQVDAMIEQM